jgi:hypothetical protein
MIVPCCTLLTSLPWHAHHLTGNIPHWFRLYTVFRQKEPSPVSSVITRLVALQLMARPAPGSKVTVQLCRQAGFVAGLYRMAAQWRHHGGAFPRQHCSRRYSPAGHAHSAPHSHSAPHTQTVICGGQLAVQWKCDIMTVSG